jgi:aminoglycoside phosphotransferase (APT) family kinase protein
MMSLQDPSESLSAILVSLRRMSLLQEGQNVHLQALTGGVSSDIYRADLPGGSICVKRALPKLKVSADWRAPTERNRHEVGWMRFVQGIAPDAVPRVLAADDEGLAFAMQYLEPHRHPVWKAELRDGKAVPQFAAALGRLLGRIHSASADRTDLASAFATDANFHAIRLEPYLVASAQRHPDLAQKLEQLVRTTATTRRVLVHGDVSPKNILCGPKGPVILDAECAWFGDPAFDLAFCLNHLLLKAIWRPAHAQAYADCLRAMRDAYLQTVDWEPAATLERRTADLLPALLLARIDGKSPVEYLSNETNRDSVRTFARQRLQQDQPDEGLDPVLRAWLTWLRTYPPETEQ